MSQMANARPTLVIPEAPPSRLKRWMAIPVGMTAVLAVVIWQSGFKPSTMWASPAPVLSTYTVDEGSMLAVVTENGTLESSNNATVRCKVEALIGTVGGQQGAQGGRNGQQPQNGQQGGAAGAQNPQPQQQPAKSKTTSKARAGASASKAKSATKTSSTAGAASGGSTTASAASGSGGGGSGGSGGGGGGGGGAGGGMGGGGGAAGAVAAPTATQVVLTKPMIRSFSYMVMPYMSLRPKVVAQQPAQNKQQGGGGGMGGGGGGQRGGGGGGGGGGQGGGNEKPGSTRIISILPEGTPVQAGAVVCTLESSAFVDEVRAQKIRYLQAQSYVEQARATLEVNLITLEEYRDGIYPQDVQLVKQYLATCQKDEVRSANNLKWSKETLAKGFRTPTQVLADELAYQQTQIALKEAQGMLVRLEKYTGPKLKKNLEAKIQAIKSDRLAQEAAFELEKTRLQRLEMMVENCILLAPRDGIVVYASKPDMWGRVSDLIDEGATVREGQQIFHLPDPKHMQVRAKINESKVSLVHKGLRARILIDAFPDRPLMGTVSQVTAMPGPANGPISDVKVYWAIVTIDSEGFDAIRPGLSAEVNFLVNEPRKVTRIPLQAIRFVNNLPYVAVASAVAGADPKQEPSWQWRSLTLGETDTMFAEVVSGLSPGERVIARPDLLPAPRGPSEEKPNDKIAYVIR